MLIGLDLSAAFDTVDHRLLLDRHRLEFGVTAAVLDWLQSYLEGMSQLVKVGQHQSPTIGVDVGVPQGSVLGPLPPSNLTYCLHSTGGGQQPVIDW